jgi:hypothetical protein
MQNQNVMKLFNQDSELILETVVTDDSYSYYTIKGEHSLTLYFSSPEFIEIPTGAYCDFFGTRYTLKKDSNFIKQGSRNYEYTLVMETDQEDLKNWKVRNIADNRIKFSLTATPKEHLQLLVDNLNLRGSGWKVGKCVEGTEMTFEYNHTYIYDGLNDLADELDTEWEIVSKTVNLCKVEYNKENPLPLSYGKGNGFKVGVGRESGDLPVEILLVQGTDRNIDYSKYGSLELLLPKSQTIEYEGRTYVTSEDGLSVQRADKALSTYKEDSLDLTEIYPSRVGDVSEVVAVDAGNNLYDIVDAGIPETLDFNDYLITGETMTVIFQTGMLAGREFEVKYIHKAKTVYGVDKAARRFEIVPADNDGVTMPGGVYVPAVGDKYAVFGIQLPDDYICNNETKTGASWDMLREAVKYLYEHEEKEFTFTGTLDSIWAKRRWKDIGGKIMVGGYILFSDPHFMPDGTKIRITGVKRYVNNPYKPEIELSNTTVGGSISSDLNKPSRDEVTNEESVRNAIAYTKRRFRDAKETMDMLENSMLNFSGSINPVAIQTMQLLAGDESLQFRFVSSMTNPVKVTHTVSYDSTTHVLTSPAGIIQHLTLGITDISSSHKASDYKYWKVSEYVSAPLNDPDAKFYLYAKVSKSAATGTFVLRESAVAMEEVSGYYHLLVGLLNSEYDGDRSFVTLYGFTEILPGRITTDRIVSSDGDTYFDLLNGIICGKIKFLSGSDGLSSLDGYEGLTEDIQSAISSAGEAKKAADNAQTSADDANKAVSELGDYVDGAFKDGLIDETEANAIASYINTVNSTEESVKATYEELSGNEYLSDSKKTSLADAYNALMNAISSLTSSINDAIKDGKATSEEKEAVDSAYDTFNTALASYNATVESAYDNIRGNILISADDSAKEEVAKLGETIIDGGYIRTDLINATELIVRHVLVETDDDDDKRSIEISPENMSIDIKDKDGEECATFEGNAYSSIAKLFGNTSGTCSIKSRTSTCYGYASGITLGRGTCPTLRGSDTLTTDEDGYQEYTATVILSDVWSTDTPTEVTVKGHLYAYAFTYRTDSDRLAKEQLRTGASAAIPTTLGLAYALVSVRVRTYSDSECTSLIDTKAIASKAASSCADLLVDETQTSEAAGGWISIEGKKAKTVAGYHRVELYIRMHANKSSMNYANVSWGATSTSRTDISASYQSEFYVSRFFANGFCLGTRQDNYVTAYKDSSDNMFFAYQNGGFGLKCSSEGIQTKHHGGNWLTMPQLVFRGRAYYYKPTSGSATYNWDDANSFDGNYPKLSRADKGQIKLTFPDSWTTKLGTLSLSNLLINIVGYGQDTDSDNPVKANLYEFTSTYLTVTISDDASENDGSFLINIWSA